MTRYLVVVVLLVSCGDDDGNPGMDASVRADSGGGGGRRDAGGGGGGRDAGGGGGGELDCNDFDSWPAAWAAEEERALEEMNRNRGAGTACVSGPQATSGAFTMDRELRIAARCHSMDMAQNNFFSHTGSGDTNFVERANTAGYSGGPRAENIAAGNATGVPTVGQWMGSETGHCEAIMNEGYNEVGIGYMQLSGTRWTHYWTAVFGARR
ncbi:MAG: CAP domain-containing protein [Myxococcota bacterium]